MVLFSARFHAIASAYLSIAAGIIEAVMSIMAGSEEGSMSLYGIALMSFVDIAGSFLVLSLWQCSSAIYGADRPKSERIKEIRYSIVIGYLMIFLGIFLLSDSIKTMVFHHEPRHITPLGLIVSIFGATCGIGLAAYKVVVGRALDSPVIIADSISSLCSGLSSAAAILIVFIGRKVWWSDSATGFAVAIYTLYCGATTVISSNSEFKRLEFKSQGDALFFKSRAMESTRIDTDIIIDVHHDSDDHHMMHHHNNHHHHHQRSFMEIIADNLSWFRTRDGYYRLPELDSDIDEEITFST